MGDIKKQYQKERKRIQQYIKRYEKQGYSFGSFTLPKTPKKITHASIRKLKRLSASALKKKRVFVDPQTGEILTGNKLVQYEKLHTQKGDLPFIRQLVAEGFQPTYISKQRLREMEAMQPVQPEEAIQAESAIKSEPPPPITEEAASLINQEDYDYADMVIDNLLDEMRQHGKIGDMFATVINEVAIRVGRKALAEALQSLDYEWYEYFTVLMYDSDKAVAEFNMDLVNAIPGITEEERNAMIFWSQAI